MNLDQAQLIVGDRVSIPFKREGTCELIAFAPDFTLIVVSIPFKREGTCELLGNLFRSDYEVEFQFPSNGKARVNATAAESRRNRSTFQFPSNGKARVNSCCNNRQVFHRRRVSIPFKREGTCEQRKLRCIVYKV